MSSPDNKPSIYDLGTVISSSPTLDILEIDSRPETMFEDLNFSTDADGLPIEPSVSQLESSSYRTPKKATIWVHKYPHWEPRPRKELAPVLVVDFTSEKSQVDERQELQVA